LETLGFSGGEAAGYEALITPISIAGERLGTLFLYRRQDSFSIEDIILIEYSTTVVGLEMMRAVQEEADQEEHKKKNFCPDSADAAGTESCVICDPHAGRRDGDPCH
jgi:transcriptional pleiotropic repressor